MSTLADLSCAGKMHDYGFGEVSIILRVLPLHWPDLNELFATDMKHDLFIGMIWVGCYVECCN